MLGVLAVGEGFLGVELNTTNNGIALKGNIRDTTYEIFHLVLL